MTAGACRKHGPQKSWDVVCLAIGDAHKEGQAVGFVWGVHQDDGSHWAVCTYCDEVIGGGGARPHRGVPLCHGCFLEAWELNGRPEKFQ
jgi:hypothetical protein